MIAGLIVFLFVLAAVFAYWEVQIEGSHGWAEKLPTWRKSEGRIFKLLGNRPLTGYHIGMILFLILLFHFPLFFAVWNPEKEIFLIGYILAFLTIEDLFLFLVNPAYGLKWGPEDFYWIYTVLAIVLMFFGSKGF